MASRLVLASPEKRFLSDATSTRTAISVIATVSTSRSVSVREENASGGRCMRACTSMRPIASAALPARNPPGLSTRTFSTTVGPRLSDGSASAPIDTFVPVAVDRKTSQASRTATDILAARLLPPSEKIRSSRDSRSCQYGKNFRRTRKVRMPAATETASGACGWRRARLPSSAQWHRAHFCADAVREEGCKWVPRDLMWRDGWS